jgi:hypothetical protein
MDAKDSFLDECGEDAAGIFDQEAETASEIGII